MSGWLQDPGDIERAEAACTKAEAAEAEANSAKCELDKARAALSAVDAALAASSSSVLRDKLAPARAEADQVVKVLPLLVRNWIPRRLDCSKVAYCRPSTALGYRVHACNEWPM